MLSYHQADLPNIGTVNAQTYGRAISRVSYYVEADVLGGQVGRYCSLRCIAVVERLLRVYPVPASEFGRCPILRLAICKVYAPQPAMCSEQLLVVREAQVRAVHKAVPLDSICSVLVSAKPLSPEAVARAQARDGVRHRRFYSDDQGKIFFARAGNVSKSR